MSDDPRPLAMYPAVGDFQVCCGRINGVWYTWNRIDGVDQKKYPQPNQMDAFEVHDGSIEYFKLTGVLK